MHLEQFGFCNPDIQRELTERRASNGHYDKLHSKEVRDRITETVRKGGAAPWSSDLFKELASREKWFHFYSGSKRKLGVYVGSWHCVPGVAQHEIWTELNTLFGVDVGSNLPATIRRKQLHTRGITVSYSALTREQLESCNGIGHKSSEYQRVMALFALPADLYQNAATVDITIAVS